MRHAAAVLAVAALTSAGAPATAVAQHGGHESAVSIGFGDFVPQHLDVLSGDTVMWTNDSVRTHTVTALDESWDSGRLTPGGAFARRFDVTGHVDYFCRLHVIRGSLDVHTVLLEPSPAASGPGRPRELSGRAAVDQGTPISIEADSGDGFVPVETLQAEQDGSFHTEIAPRTTTRYRARVASEVSPPVTIVVLDRRVAVSVHRRGRRTVITAGVTPPSPGVMAVLQLRLAHHFGWWPVQRERLNRASRARFVLRRRPHAPARVVLTLPDGATVTAVSRTLRPAAGSGTGALEAGSRR